MHRSVISVENHTSEETQVTVKRHLKININYLIVHVRLARSGTLGVTKADFIQSPD